MRNITNVLEFLENSANNYPDKIAFADDKVSITYKDLVQKARAYGSYLATKVEPTQPIAILGDKSVDSIISFFSCVYAGCFYVPLNTRHPKERIQLILDTLDKPYVIVHTNFDRFLPEYDESKILRLDADAKEDPILLNKIRENHIDVDPLYVLFTSGSTGTPKGIAVSHRSVIDFITIFTDIFDIKADEIIGNQAPFDFDVSTKDIYSTISVGATMEIIPKGKFSFPTFLVDYLIERKVTTLIWAVSALTILSTLKAFDYKVPTDIKKVLFSGEVMPINQLNIWKEHLPNTKFINLYGPTEITCNCSYYEIPDGPFTKDVLPIGKTFPNERIILLDEELNEVKNPRDVGEICVSGTALAMGYYNKKVETDAAFIQNPLNSRYIEPIYRTGDLGYYNEDGELCFIGRRDFQIKYMGHRIELSEIESAISQIEGIDKAVVLFSQKEEKIWAFYKGDIEPKAIAKALNVKIPQYMVPSKFEKVDHFDLTENGKTDRKKLAKEYNL
ncbi:MAG: amino acid adenylation domain-containing protein [Clostridia bacterium]|nr:amino acid adenylation domain-containing protein [Clostridia bacterium]